MNATSPQSLSLIHPPHRQTISCWLIVFVINITPACRLEIINQVSHFASNLPQDDINDFIYLYGVRSANFTMHKIPFKIMNVPDGALSCVKLYVAQHIVINSFVQKNNYVLALE